MENKEEEVLFETWLYKYNAERSKRVIGFRNKWKRKYFVLKRMAENVVLLYFDAKPQSGKQLPKGKFPLAAGFRVAKKYNEGGKPFVCQITLPGREISVGTSDEKIFHLFAFFMQAQIKLREEFEEECFVVRPENTEELRKIGAKGNMCLLHISKGGVTIALQLSKCVIGQWPLKTIRCYESTGRGHFGFEAGKFAPMGKGQYNFSTRVTQDVLIYDKLDKYVMEAAGLAEVSTPERLTRRSSETMDSEHEELKSLVHVYCDADFIPHIRRISRDMYDNLSEHLGNMEASSRSLSESSSPMNSLPRRDGSRTEFVATPPPLQPSARQTMPLPRHHYENSSVTVAADTRPVRSQYMQVGSPVIVGTPSPPNLPNSTPPPSFLEATLTPEDEYENERVHQAGDESRHFPSSSFRVGSRFDTQRQLSRSADDLLRSDSSSPFVYNNNSYEAAEAGNFSVGLTYTTAGKLMTPLDAVNAESENRYVRESRAPGAGLEPGQGDYDEDYAVPYSRVRPSVMTSRMRKSVSNPDFLQQHFPEQNRGGALTQENIDSNATERKRLWLGMNTLQTSVEERQQGPLPLTLQINNSNSNQHSWSFQQSDALRIASPPVTSIHTTVKTKIFKRQDSHTHAVMRTLSDHPGDNRGAEGTSETLC